VRSCDSCYWHTPYTLSYPYIVNYRSTQLRSHSSVRRASIEFTARADNSHSLDRTAECGPLQCFHCIVLHGHSIQTFKHTNNDSLLSWGTADGYSLRLFKVAESKTSWMEVRNIFRPKLTHCPLHLHRPRCQTYATGFSNDEEKQSTPRVYYTKLEQPQWASQLCDKQLCVGLICHPCILSDIWWLWLRQLKHHNLQTARICKLNKTGVHIRRPRSTYGNKHRSTWALCARHIFLVCYSVFLLYTLLIE
jgi:hypothetical protein